MRFFFLKLVRHHYICVETDDNTNNLILPKLLKCGCNKVSPLCHSKPGTEDKIPYYSTQLMMMISSRTQHSEKRQNKIKN